VFKRTLVDLKYTNVRLEQVRVVFRHKKAPPRVITFDPDDTPSTKSDASDDIYAYP
jgi:hypothetical protein